MIHERQSPPQRMAVHIEAELERRFVRQRLGREVQDDNGEE